jgi:hypothetical protein
VLGNGIIIHAAGVQGECRVAGRYHPRRRRAVWETEIPSGKCECLSCRVSTLEFVAEVLKVFLTDLQLLHLFDHRNEVCQ